MNKLTGSSNPTFEYNIEENALYMEIYVYSQSSFQIPHDYIVNRHGVAAAVLETPLSLIG